MKKRFNLTWRLVVAAVLLCALVPAALIGVNAQAATIPTTYIDPLPAYSESLPAYISGTSATGAQTLQKVRLQVKSYDSLNAIYRYWDEGVAGWTTDAEAYAYTYDVGASGWNGQWDWQWAGITTVTPLTDGNTYIITAWAIDSN
ncbi:MAG: hypothetical protein E4G89_03435, partial [Methanothrix sp.]